MMHWLTDRPETASRFLPPGTAWAPMATTDPHRDIMQSFASGASGWQVTTPGSSARTVVIIDDAADSQFDVVVELLKHGVNWPDRLVAIALTGQRFRGQRQRPWSALRGNLHLTSHYVIDVDAAQEQSFLTMIPAVAAGETIHRLSTSRFRPMIKWVNDILVDGAKVAGVLTATSVRGSRVRRVTFGVGINIAQAPHIEPAPFVPPAGCLADYDPSLRDKLPDIMQTLVACLDEGVEQLNSGQGRDIFERYRDMSLCMGQRVRIWPEDMTDERPAQPICEGEVRSMHPDLSLEISGYPQRITRGRMTLV